MSATAEICRQFTVDNVGATDLDAQADNLAQALLDLEISGCGLSDSTVTTDPFLGHIDVELVTVGDTFASATATAEWCMRAALYIVGGTTSGWHLDRGSQRGSSSNA